VGTKSNRDARAGTTSAGGGQGAACAKTPRPSVDVRAIETASATPPQRQSGPTQTQRHGDDNHGGGDDGPRVLERGRHHPSTCSVEK
jgi:hypothetical protein